MSLILDAQPGTPPAGQSTISPTELRTLLEAGADLIVADASEGDDYAGGHISVSVPVPASEVELRLADVAARPDVPIVFTSSTPGVGAQAAKLARRAGYTDVRVLEGGNPGWVAAGYRLITNLNALSKALGEYVERRYGTPRVSVDELRAKIDAGEDIVVLDTRPYDEYHAISIPGGIDAPGPELLYRAYDQVRRPTTQVVINCAGRTRAILGAQTLINAGFPNPVVSLENGTTAWLLAGHQPGRGDTAVAGPPTGDNRARAARAAHDVARRFGVREIGRAELDALRATAGERSLYLFDVRTPEEYADGHLAGTRSVPGGQLVQKTDYYIGSRHGRVVLVDDEHGVRARTTAAWLIQLGLPDVAVYLFGDEEVVSGAVPSPPQADAAVSIGVEELAQRLDGPVPRPLVIDLEPARPYVLVRHHIPNSVYARRSSLARLLAYVPDDVELVFTSADGRLAALAAAEVTRPARALAGGTQAWRDSGRPVDVGSGQDALDENEALPAPPTLAQRRAHLDWYVAWGDHIVEELEQDGLVRFVGPVSATQD